MAEIKFKGFVQKHEGNRPWEVAESHSVKEGDSWVVKSKTYHKVWLPRDAEPLTENDLVEVVGRQITPEKKGDYKPTPVVYADTVTLVRAGNRSGTPRTAPAEPWAVDESAPF